MHTLPTTTLSFPLSTAKLFLTTRFRSQLATSQRKSPLDMISNLNRLVTTKIMSIYSQAFHRSTEVQMLYEYSKASQQENCSNNFLCSKKIYGEENSGVMVSTLQQSESGETGMWSKNMSEVRERQWKNCNSSHYSPKARVGSYPVGLPRG